MQANEGKKEQADVNTLMSLDGIDYFP